MSLQFRLNLIILLICFFTLLLGGAVTIINARHSVFEEISSSLLLAERLIDRQINDSQFSGLDNVRHLRVAVITGEKNTSPPLLPDNTIDPNVPELFSWFVRPNLEHRSLWLEKDNSTQFLRLVADPRDEIREAWREAQVFIIFLLLLTFLISGCVFIVIGRALRPVDDILLAFAEIEKGDYQKRLQHFNLPEFSRISESINHLSEKLMLSKEENRRLNKHALDVRESERHYLARELHDEMGQSLTAVKALTASVKPGNEPQVESLNKIDQICGHLFDVIRNRMRQLTPPLLNEFGLPAAIDELVDKWPSNVPVKLTIDDDIDVLVGSNAIHYYRVIQESLTNIFKHAQATQVEIELKQVGGNVGRTIQLSIKDNGVGFNHNEVSWGGLFGIKERINSLGGKLEITSGSGTKLSAILPIEVNAE
jgi:two-component system sensor histidine kinase UhpB